LQKARTVGILTGGSGSSKLVSAFELYFPEEIEPIYIANVADNFWRFGVFVCPDIDIVTFTLAGLLEDSKGWGVKNDTKNFLKMYSKLVGSEEWFGLGDTDLAVSIFRTQLLKSGLTLQEATQRVCQSLGIKRKVVPASNDDVETYLKTPEGRMHLQDFWVRLRGSPDVTEIEYMGIEAAEPTSLALSSISDVAIILPANPVSSIMPTVSLRGLKQKLRSAKVIAISPFIGEQVFSGPAEFLKIMLVDNSESGETERRIRDLGVECVKTNIRLTDGSAKGSMVREILELI
jgi:LPPG:FO 2-phospho-L-lactate transferase